MERRTTPWGKLPALVVWLAIVATLTCVLKTGLGGLGIPGLSGWWLWVAAGALSSIECVLVEGFRRHGNVWLLIAAVGTAGATLGAEYLNVENTARSHAAVVDAAAAPIQRARERESDARRTLEAVEAEVRRLDETRTVWNSDGDPSNDGLLPAALAARGRAREELKEAEQALDAETREAEKARAGKNALADAPRWAILAFLALLKVGLVGVGWVLGAPPRLQRPLESSAGPPGLAQGPGAAPAPASNPEQREGERRPCRSTTKKVPGTRKGPAERTAPLIKLARQALANSLNVV